jgi:rhodanese-related sulfurtransferase
VLEQAGFSSTRKLVGLFYGYDFTVLRVFFTAGITAMAGVLLMNHYGLLNKEILYINPAFINSALVGGAIMGAGFIIGGFCPGTSVCALAIGKLDALAFVVGIVVGVWGFIELFPSLEKLYLAGYLGQIKLSEYLGMSDIVFAALLAFIAVTAFIITWLIENRVTKRAPSVNLQLKKRYAAAVIVLFAVLGIVAFIPGRNDIIKMRIAEARRQQTCVFKEIPADKLANEIVSNHYMFNIIDVRPEQEFEKYHLPMAINIPFEKMMEVQYKSVFKQRLKTNVFYADSDTLVRMACLKAKYIGKADNYILKESVHQFREMFFEVDPPPANALKSQLDLYHFRTTTAQKMEYLVNSLKNIGAPVKMEPVTVKGGC